MVVLWGVIVVSGVVLEMVVCSFVVVGSAVTMVVWGVAVEVFVFGVLAVVDWCFAAVGSGVVVVA